MIKGKIKSKNIQKFLHAIFFHAAPDMFFPYMRHENRPDDHDFFYRGIWS